MLLNFKWNFWKQANEEAETQKLIYKALHSFETQTLSLHTVSLYKPKYILKLIYK